jgi:hypothetical protein
MRLLWVFVVFVLVVIAVFVPGARVFSSLAHGAQQARLYGEAKEIAVTANSLDGEGSMATVEVSLLEGRIVIAPGYVRAEGGKGFKVYPANTVNALTLEEGRHTLRLEHTGEGVRASRI